MKETGKTKIIVFSDSHGSSVNMLKIAGLYRYSADYFIFLGDGLGDLQKIRDLTDKPLIAVPGNCDRFFSSVSFQRPPEDVYKRQLLYRSCRTFSFYNQTFRLYSDLSKIKSEMHN